MAGHGEVVGHQRYAGRTRDTSTRKPARSSRFCSNKPFASDDAAFAWDAGHPGRSRWPCQDRWHFLRKGEAQTRLHRLCDWQAPGLVRFSNCFAQ
ncbi:hypothetical protein NY96_15420 [Xanthomonas citri pv. fuscans]|nr:hypothetical protein NY96_15420 [Xanthomonas citri pv. fuscans]